MDGIKLYEEADFEGALSKFGEALALRDTPQIRFNIARCLDKLGRLVAATNELKRARADAAAINNASLETTIAEYLAKVEPRVAHLVLSAKPANATLKVDGVGVAAGNVAVDPGKRTVVATDGKKAVTNVVTLKEGETKKLALIIP